MTLAQKHYVAVLDVVGGVAEPPWSLEPADFPQELRDLLRYLLRQRFNPATDTRKFDTELQQSLSLPQGPMVA